MGVSMDIYTEYYSIVSKIKELNSQKEKFKKLVLQDLKEKGVMSSEENGIKATMSVRQTVKYDKDGIRSYLESKGHDSALFDKTELDMDKVEKLLINQGKLKVKEIATYVDVKTTDALLRKETR